MASAIPPAQHKYEIVKTEKSMFLNLTNEMDECNLKARLKNKIKALITMALVAKIQKVDPQKLNFFVEVLMTASKNKFSSIVSKLQC